MARCYVRNGVWGWSIEDQEKALSAADVLDPGQLYRDVLPEARAKKPSVVRPEWLEERARLLRPTGRKGGEMIYVATWTAFAVSEGDLIEALTDAWERDATITALDSGVSISGSSSDRAIVAVLHDWRRAKEAARTKPGRALGWQAAAAKKNAETDRKLVAARPLWRSRKPDRPSVADIAELSGLSPKTLYNRLHERPAIERKSRGK